MHAQRSENTSQHGAKTPRKITNVKTQPKYLVLDYTGFNIVCLCSGIVALIETPSQLQVVEPYLQECVHVTCCTQVGKANKCVLDEGKNKKREREREREINCLFRYKSIPGLVITSLDFSSPASTDVLSEGKESQYTISVCVAGLRKRILPCLDALNLGHRYCGKHFHQSRQAMLVHQYPQDSWDSLCSSSCTSKSRQNHFKSYIASNTKLHLFCVETIFFTQSDTPFKMSLSMQFGATAQDYSM